MLEHLARHPGALVTPGPAEADLGQRPGVRLGLLRLYMSQLRKKLEAEPAAPEHLLTESGMGYRLVP